ncbi:MAG: glycosyl hydrolase [Oscillospiraceae bacterium]|nr:glycosyl hydrolase [Oscillospiraceae bacterium]
MTHLTIPANTPLTPLDKHWQFCVGSGHAGLALRADYGRLLKQAHEELGMERVRFHGIFGSAMHTMHSLRDILPLPGAKKYVETSFRTCGLAYDNVLAAGMKPFVELGFMPPLLAKRNSKSLMFYKPNISLPKDYGTWARYIQAFIRFLQQRYGEKEIRTWFFEVWNEPDLRIVFFRGSQSDYFKLYEVTVRAIKEIDPEIRVGGPSTSNSTWVAEFVEFCGENNVPVDFVSTHQYSGDAIGIVKDANEIQEQSVSIPKLVLDKLRNGLKCAPRDAILPAYRRFMGDETEDKDLPAHVFRTNAPIAKQRAKGLPLYYTEWNLSATFSAYSNDTRKAASYVLKTCLALEGVVDGTSLWVFSDIFEELHPFPEEFHGGFGLMTQGGVKKPAFHGMKMLADAGPARYELPGALDGEIAMAAFRGETETQVLLIRQKMKNLFELPKEQAQVEIELAHEPQRVYLQRIDETHCNPLKLWEAMGSPQVPTPAQLAQLQTKSAMIDEELPCEWQEGKLSFQVALGVNDVYFVRVVR